MNRRSPADGEGLTASPPVPPRPDPDSTPTASDAERRVRLIWERTFRQSATSDADRRLRFDWGL